MIDPIMRQADPVGLGNLYFSENNKEHPESIVMYFSEQYNIFLQRCHYYESLLFICIKDV